jgi:hypothetical protein
MLMPLLLMGLLDRIDCIDEYGFLAIADNSIDLMEEILLRKAGKEMEEIGIEENWSK